LAVLYFEGSAALATLMTAGLGLGTLIAGAASGKIGIFEVEIPLGALGKAQRRKPIPQDLNSTMKYVAVSDLQATEAAQAALMRLY